MSKKTVGVERRREKIRKERLFVYFSSGSGAIVSRILLSIRNASAKGIAWHIRAYIRLLFRDFYLPRFRLFLCLISLTLPHLRVSAFSRNPTKGYRIACAT